MTNKDFISANNALFEEVIQDKNKADENGYYVEKPSAEFWYANSGMLLTSHKMDSIKISFDGAAINRLDYVFEGRAITTTISNIGRTSLINRPTVTE